MAEAQSQPKTMRIKISYRDETLSMSHHTINVIGGITDGQNGIWYTKDTTSLPVEIQITIPDYIEKEFYIIPIDPKDNFSISNVSPMKFKNFQSTVMIEFFYIHRIFVLLSEPNPNRRQWCTPQPQ
jgi:hypothetical protein